MENHKKRFTTKTELKHRLAWQGASRINFFEGYPVTFFKHKYFDLNFYTDNFERGAPKGLVNAPGQ